MTGWRSTKRYPWWVKTADAPTTQIDLQRSERPPLYGLLGRPEIIAQVAVGWRHLKSWIDDNTPGRGLPDVALHYAFSSYFTGSSHIEGGFKTTRPEVWKAVKTYVPTPEELGVSRWEGSEEEASAMVAHAGLQLGAAEVGFAPVEPMWLFPNARIDPDAAEPELGDQAWSEKVIPKRFATVVVVGGEVPYEMARHAPSELGNAGDRCGYARAEMSHVMLINFITALGYQSIDLPGPTIPFAVAAGFGEVGRMNRLVSPVYGGNIRLYAFLTDLPLALDNPIDFGLQRFCVRCKKCAEACPPGALSFEDGPTWEPQGDWSAPGKKVYFENSRRCCDWVSGQGGFCGACMAACPWTKPDTPLHKLGRAVAATFPKFSDKMIKLDDAFGFGLVPSSEKTRGWWRG